MCRGQLDTHPLYARSLLGQRRKSPFDHGGDLRIDGERPEAPAGPGAPAGVEADGERRGGGPLRRPVGRELVTESGRRRLPYRAGPRPLQALDLQRAPSGNVSGPADEAEAVWHAGLEVEQVLDRHRHAVQRTELTIAGEHRALGFPRSFACLLMEDRYVRVQRGGELVDPSEMR